MQRGIRVDRYSNIKIKGCSLICIISCGWILYILNYNEREKKNPCSRGRSAIFEFNYFLNLVLSVPTSLRTSNQLKFKLRRQDTDQQSFSTFYQLIRSPLLTPTNKYDRFLVKSNQNFFIA